MDKVDLVLAKQARQSMDDQRLISGAFVQFKHRHIVYFDPIGRGAASVQANQRWFEPVPIEMVQQPGHAPFQATGLERVNDVGHTHPPPARAKTGNTPHARIATLGER
jgi:hypothetical protein